MLLKTNNTSAGVYLFKNKLEQIIYVGKAKNLSARIRSYQNALLAPRTQKLVTEIASVETIEVDSEIEALILEANLIKRYSPVFNFQLKDDKDYLYIKIVKESFPRVLASRKKDLTDAKEYFGPYPSARSVRTSLRLLRKIFPFRSCKVNQGKPCFYFHLGLCPGVCVGQVTEREYLKNINKLRLFLKGNKRVLLGLLEKEMKASSGRLDFETAGNVKKKIEAINYITRPTRHIDEYVEADSIDEIRSHELDELATVLKLKEKPSRIECYDISNFQGKEAVGSMVVFSNGRVDKANYRRFRIKDFQTPNDFGMMAEVIRRRLKNDWPLPDLILVDGGKGQISSASKQLAQAKITIPLFGLAKRNEDIYTQKGERISLPKDSQALYLLQRVRDEAHRFAIGYYRKLAKTALLT